MCKGIHFKERHRHSGKGVNFILFRGLNHRQFRQLLFTSSDLYRDLLYFCNIRWLSRDEMLRRVYILRKNIANFFEKNINSTEFRNQEWIPNWPFSVNLILHLDNLNWQL